MEKEELIARISGEVVSRLSLDKGPHVELRPSSGTLVVVNDIDPHLDVTLQEISRLATPAMTTFMLCKEAEAYLIQSGLDPSQLCLNIIRESEMEKAVHTLALYNTLVFPSPTVMFLKRLAQLNDDDPYVRLAHGALLNGARLLIITDHLKPKKEREHGVPVGMIRAVDNALKAVEQRNIKLVGTSSLSSFLGHGQTTSRKRLISEKDILSMRHSGVKRLVVARGTIVTPSAKDRARSEGIEIIEGNIEEDKQ